MQCSSHLSGTPLHSIKAIKYWSEEGGYTTFVGDKCIKTWQYLVENVMSYHANNQRVNLLSTFLWHFSSSNINFLLFQFHWLRGFVFCLNWLLCLDMLINHCHWSMIFCISLQALLRIFLCIILTLLYTSCMTSRLFSLSQAPHKPFQTRPLSSTTTDVLSNVGFFLKTTLEGK